MYLMYVDESGDPGLVNSPTPIFVLTGMVMHELRWRPYLDQLVDFRRRMRASFGLKLREEIHASAMLSRSGHLRRIAKHDRASILRFFAKELSNMPDLNIINVIVDKRTKAVGYDVFERAWTALIQRMENTISHRNFRGPANPDDLGMILPDHTADKSLTNLIRKMRRYNPIPNLPRFGGGYRNLTLASIAEDPNFRDSGHSFFVQACDLLAFLLYQRENPASYARKFGVQNYFKIIDPILCKQAARNDPHGIVRL